MRDIWEGWQPERRFGTAQGTDALNELEQRHIAILQRPINPADLVILAVGVVVALLGPPDFVSTQEHRHAT
jgi:hypothetical protein